MTDCPACSSCRSFAPTPESEVSNLAPAGSGQCRRRAPLGSALGPGVGRIAVVPFHPLVHDGHWCGEHEPISTPSPDPKPTANRPRASRNDS